MSQSSIQSVALRVVFNLNVKSSQYTIFMASLPEAVSPVYP